MSRVASTTTHIALRPAFYALIQFCPDRVRGERINIGIILEAPRSSYVRVKFRRYMESSLRCLDPGADTRLVSMVTKALENNLKSPESTNLLPAQGALISNVERPHNINQLTATFNFNSRSPWWITESQPIFLPENQSLDERLNILHKNLVANRPHVERISWDKSFAKKRTIDGLKIRDVEVLENPPALPARGQVWAQSSFDALYQRRHSTYFQVFSFDTQSPDLDQSKAFVLTVSDLTHNTPFTPANDFHYIAIVQPPVHEISNQNIEAHRSAIDGFRRSDIPCFTTDDENLGLVAHILKQEIDPRQYLN